MRDKRKENKRENYLKGKTFDEVYGNRAVEIKRKISISLKKIHGSPLTIEGRKRKNEKLRKAILKRYEDGWDPKCGRAPKIDYFSPIAGNVKLDGSWEFKVAKYLDNLKIKWERNKKRFKYINLEKKESTYRPDFFIYDWDSYLEIKGYETKLDRCKWSQFKDSLIIWKKTELIKLNIL